MRPARERQYETRSVGGAGGGGPVSPRCSHHNGVQPIPARSAEGVCRRRQRQVSAGGSGFRASGRGAEVLMWLRRNSDQPHPHRRRCNVLHAPRLQRRRRPARCLDRVETRTATRAARAVCVTLTDGPHCTLGLTWMRRACAAVAVMYTSSPLSSTCAPATGPPGISRGSSLQPKAGACGGRRHATDAVDHDQVARRVSTGTDCRRYRRCCRPGRR